MPLSKKAIGVGSGVVLVCVVALAWILHRSPEPEAVAESPARSPQSVKLTETQLKRVRVDVADARAFTERREALGYIDFDQERSVAITPPYAGRITSVKVQPGDDVGRGAVIYTIESPDLIQAESTLISSAGVLKLTSSVLQRARTLYAVQGIPQKELDQAVSEEQAADAAYRAARAAVRVFGKSENEMDRMESSRKTDSDMDVIAPFAGRVTSRNAAVGMLVQPGMSPAPLVISDVSTMWLIAAVPEQDLPALHLGQKVSVSVDAYPTRQFEAKISNIGETVDPTTRRILVRSEVRDPKHELRPQMFATFVIQTGNPVTDVGVPVGGVVREGDGTMLVWVTKDRTEFFPRPVKTGIVQDGYEQILSGVSAGEQVATEGALFLSNALATSSK